MTIVLDTSAAIEFILNSESEPGLRNIISEADWILVPTIYYSEITNVLWKYMEFQNISIQECEDALSEALKLPDDYVSDKKLAQEAFSMACLTKSAAYDMFFLVLARRTNATLITIDKKLKKLAEKYSIKVR